jgi:hypothetical protein
VALAFKGLGGSTISSAANQASLIMTAATTSGAVGDLAVLIIGVDNFQTTDGDEGAVTSVIDNAGNTWLKAGEFCNGQGTAQAGATVSVWYCKLTGAITAGTTAIQAFFSNSTARDVSAMSMAFFTTTAGLDIALEGTPTTLANDGAAVGSLNLTTANISCLRIRASASESSTVTAWTKTAAFTGLFAVANTTGGGTAANMGVRGEYLVSTGTGTASAPTVGAGTVDSASIYVAFKEIVHNVTLTATPLATGSPGIAGGLSTLTINTDQSAGIRDLGTTTSQSIGQTFTTVGALSLASVDFVMRSFGVPADNLSLDIFPTSAGLPTGSSLGTVTLLGSSFPSLGSIINFPFSPSVSLSAGTKYAFVFTRTGAFNNVNYYYDYGTPSDVYAGGSVINNLTGAGWAADPWDLYAVLHGDGLAGPVLTVNTNSKSFTATDIATADASLGAPLLSVKYTIAATPLTTAAPVLASGPLIQNHALTASPIATAAASLGAPVLVRIIALTATPIAPAATVLGAPGITQAHTVTAAPIATASPAIGAPALTQAHNLTATPIATAAAALGTPVVAIIRNLTASDLAVARPAFAVASFTQQHFFNGSFATGPPALTSGPLTQKHVVTATPIATAAAALGTPALSLNILALPAATPIATAAPSIGTPALVVNRVLTATPIATGATVIGAPAITQAHVLATSFATASPAIGVPAFSINSSALPAATPIATAAAVLGAPVLGVIRNVTAATLATASPALTSGPLTQNHKLAAAALATGAAGLGSPNLAVAGVMSAAPLSVQAPAIGPATLVQAHVLTATPLAVARPAFGTPALQGIANLVASPIATQAAAIGTPALSQKHVLAPVLIATASPVLLATVTQRHVLAAPAVATGAASLGRPVLVGASILTAPGIAAAAPVIGPAALKQAHSLTGQGIGPAAPVIGPADLSQRHGLTAVAIASGGAGIDQPDFLEGAPHKDVTAADLIIGGPAFGQPRLQSHSPDGVPGKRLRRTVPRVRELINRDGRERTLARAVPRVRTIARAP